MTPASLARLAAKAPMLSAEDEMALASAAKAGDGAARDRIILAHLRMAVATAIKFRRYGIPVDDLAQEGVLALAKALDKFDPTVGVRFSTFAAYTIRGHVGDVVLKRSTIVRPAMDVRTKRLFFVGQAERYLLERRGDLTRGEVDRRLAVRLGVTVETVRAMQAVVHGEVALDAPIGEGVAVGDMLVDPVERQDVIVERDFDVRQRRAVITDAMRCLDDRERVVVSARHLVDEGDEATFNDLAARFGVSKQRVQQIESKALRKLRDAMAPRRAELGLIAA